MEGIQLTDKSLAELRNLSLQELAFDATQITDDGLLELSGQVDLRMLDLSRSQVTDAGLERLSELSSLRFLLLTDTKVTQNGIRALRNAIPSLRILNRVEPMDRSRLLP
jgi:Leucine Rich repeat